MSFTPDAIWNARCLLRSVRSATLATQIDGQPYAALVTPAVLPDSSVLMLLSGLSEHTKHLRLDPRCAILFTGKPTDLNPQTAPRLTVNGCATPEDDPLLKNHWLALHPYAALYAALPDFTLWRVYPAKAHYVGGFARATRLSDQDLRAPISVLTALDHAAPSILRHSNEDHAQTLDDIAGAAMPGAGPGWRMVTVDADGFDLAREDVVHRLHWSAPVDDVLQIRDELVRLAHSARGKAALSPSLSCIA